MKWKDQGNSRSVTRQDPQIKKRRVSGERREANHQTKGKLPWNERIIGVFLKQTGLVLLRDEGRQALLPEGGRDAVEKANVKNTSLTVIKYHKHVPETIHKLKSYKTNQECGTFISWGGNTGWLYKWTVLQWASHRAKPLRFMDRKVKTFAVSSTQRSRRN